MIKTQEARWLLFYLISHPTCCNPRVVLDAGVCSHFPASSGVWYSYFAAYLVLSITILEGKTSLTSTKDDPIDDWQAINNLPSLLTGKYRTEDDYDV